MIAIQRPSEAHPPSYKYCGSWVDFPQPVSPSIMMTLYFSNAYLNKEGNELKERVFDIQYVCFVSVDWQVMLLVENKR